jgi:putative lipoic acid-binding regulatory protein
MALKACEADMKEKDNICKAQIEYPCQWLYKVIGDDLEKLHQILLEIVSDDTCNITFSNSSRTGKFHCLNLEMTGLRWYYNFASKGLAIHSQLLFYTIDSNF